MGERDLDLDLTPAQRRALEWLPEDGSWRNKPDRSVSAALHSLWLSHRPLIDSRHGPFGARGGNVAGFRLTPAGIEARRKIKEMKDAR